MQAFTMFGTTTTLYNAPTRVNHFFICAFYNKFRLFLFTLGSVPEFVPLVPAMFRSKEREKV
jgi:hypothetical protein